MFRHLVHLRRLASSNISVAGEWDRPVDKFRHLSNQAGQTYPPGSCYNSRGGSKKGKKLHLCRCYFVTAIGFEGKQRGVDTVGRSESDGATTTRATDDCEGSTASLPAYHSQVTQVHQKEAFRWTGPAKSFFLCQQRSVSPPPSLGPVLFRD